MDEQMREKFAERVNDAHGWQPPAPPEECCLAESRDWAVWRESWQACAAALSQPAAQGESSHPAGGECGGVQHYRLLTTDDFIESSDEFIQDDGVTWRKPVGWEIRAPYSSVFKTARRPIAAHGIKAAP